jgi:hypothetical protein
MTIRLNCHTLPAEYHLKSGLEAGVSGANQPESQVNGIFKETKPPVKVV